MYEFQSFHIPTNTWFLLVFLTLAILMGLLYLLILFSIFLVTSKIEHLLYTYWPLMKYQFKQFAPILFFKTVYYS